MPGRDRSDRTAVVIGLETTFEEAAIGAHAVAKHGIDHSREDVTFHDGDALPVRIPHRSPNRVEEVEQADAPRP